MAESNNQEKKVIRRQRAGILFQLENWLEKPMVFLGFVWLILLILELTRGLGRSLQVLATAIWILFILEFLLRFAIAPKKLRFLRKSWLTIIALAIPALRVFRIFQALRVLRLARATRSLRLVRVVTSVNRGMASLGATLQQNGFGYMLALTLVVTVAGAAGMYAFERSVDGSSGFTSYTHSLWWTAMLVTTMGSDFWPQTSEGRVLCLLISVYAFAVWGYVTATIATFFLGERKKQAPVNTARELQALRLEIQALRKELKALASGDSQPPPNA